MEANRVSLAPRAGELMFSLSFAQAATHDAFGITLDYFHAPSALNNPPPFCNSDPLFQKKQLADPCIPIIPAADLVVFDAFNGSHEFIKLNFFFIH